MDPEPRLTLSVLSAEHFERFRRDGYVRVKQAFSPALALEMQDEIWSELREEHGIRHEDPATWTTPAYSPRRAKHLPLNETLASGRFLDVIGDLLGHDSWPRPGSWGGFLVNFPEETDAPWDVRDDHWHWDGSSTSTGLLIFSFYSHVRHAGGGTLLLSGSHRLVEDFYASLSPADLAQPHKAHRKMFARWDPWLEALMGRAKEPVEDRVATFMERTTDVRGVPCRVVELTGEPGDAVFCDLGMLHSTSPNRSDSTRFMRSKFLFVER